MQVASQNEPASPSPVVRRDVDATQGMEVYSMVEQLMALNGSTIHIAPKEESREL